MTEFQIITDADLLKATLFNRSSLSASGCWEWVGSKDGKGYGMLSRDNKTLRAHRVSYQAFKGEIPKGHGVLHSCDNPSCINPNHLRTGTQAENVSDRESRGRRDVKGEQIGTSKLNETQIREIRASSLSLKELGEIYGVDKSNIHCIRAGKTWKHVSSHAGL